MEFDVEFKFTPEVTAIIDWIGGATGLSRLNAYQVQNHHTGILFRISGRNSLDLKAVVAIIPEKHRYALLIRPAIPDAGVVEFLVPGDQLLPVIQSELKKIQKKQIAKSGV
jgi:hypothetical protein